MYCVQRKKKIPLIITKIYCVLRELLLFFSTDGNWNRYDYLEIYY